MRFNIGTAYRRTSASIKAEIVAEHGEAGTSMTRREEPATVYRTVEQVLLCVANGRTPAVHEAVAAPPIETVTLAKPPPRRPR
ncbi:MULTISPECIES: hypothetical protein [Nocardia]|uniref:Uncharacterized protein n=2 Tax=Nocardia TaxID=1817 RepID=U5E7X4_NOCAS|nr:MULTISPECIES: hypothetical protein [Nocardia]TLF67661.1 hypothetical protein FEK33_17250 [Nocardia asteroides NBRC 15531]UGT50782.1 hypothetical protein LT345_09660 [Nocardia asteroides]GAD83435.1 hypothetical protein NCAST_19_01370 [Nocardia asteroides NBRC 15531]